jgi:hypothetical protein
VKYFLAQKMRVERLPWVYKNIPQEQLKKRGLAAVDARREEGEKVTNLPDTTANYYSIRAYFRNLNRLNQKFKITTI